MGTTESIWEASPEELAAGYVRKGNRWCCLICGREIEEGVVHRIGEGLYTSERAAIEHIESDHGGVFPFLLDLDKKIKGLGGQQTIVLAGIYEGKSDEEIAREMKIKPATVRIHRFTLREREKKAVLFLAMIKLAGERSPRKQRLIAPHEGAKMVDERYAITEEEHDKILKKYFREDGTLSTFPLKEKRRLIILRRFAAKFESGRRYAEKEVNAIIQPVYDDYELIRRCLIEYGFMDRLPGGVAYWLRGDKTAE